MIATCADQGCRGNPDTCTSLPRDDSNIHLSHWFLKNVVKLLKIRLWFPQKTKLLSLSLWKKNIDQLMSCCKYNLDISFPNLFHIFQDKYQLNISFLQIKEKTFGLLNRHLNAKLNHQMTLKNSEEYAIYCIISNYYVFEFSRTVELYRFPGGNLFS